jgi:hypothetical protein
MYPIQGEKARPLPTREVPTRALYPVNDVSALMAVVPRWVWRTIYAGGLRTVWLDGRRLVPADVLADFIRGILGDEPGGPLIVQPWEPDREFYTVDQSAVLLGVSSRKVWELIYAEPARLRTKWAGARRLVPARVLVDFIAALPLAESKPAHRLPTQRAA